MTYSFENIFKPFLGVRTNHAIPLLLCILEFSIFQGNSTIFFHGTFAFKFHATFQSFSDIVSMSQSMVLKLWTNISILKIFISFLKHSILNLLGWSYGFGFSLQLLQHQFHWHLWPVFGVLPWTHGLLNKNG